MVNVVTAPSLQVNAQLAAVPGRLAVVDLTKTVMSQVAIRIQDPCQGAAQDADGLGPVLTNASRPGRRAWREVTVLLGPGPGPARLDGRPAPLASPSHPLALLATPGMSISMAHEEFLCDEVALACSWSARRPAAHGDEHGPAPALVSTGMQRVVITARRGARRWPVAPAAACRRAPHEAPSCAAEGQGERAATAVDGGYTLTVTRQRALRGAPAHLVEDVEACTAGGNEGGGAAGRADGGGSGEREGGRGGRGGHTGGGGTRGTSGGGGGGDPRAGHGDGGSTACEGCWDGKRTSHNGSGPGGAARAGRAPEKRASGTQAWRPCAARMASLLIYGGRAPRRQWLSYLDLSLSLHAPCPHTGPQNLTVPELGALHGLLGQRACARPGPGPRPDEGRGRRWGRGRDLAGAGDGAPTRPPPQGEGFIRGTWTDYRLEDGLFGVRFVHNRYAGSGP